jgi:hypothetical protein
MMHVSSIFRVFTKTSTALLLSFAFILGISGCGGDSVPSEGSMHAVKGKVITKSPAALAGLKIEFIPNGGGARPARGEIKPDGSFELTTRAPGDGICEGNYKVRLDRGGNLPKGKTSPIPSQYFDEDGSYLSATIKSDTTEIPPFDLKPIVGTAADGNRSGRKDND